MNLETAETPEDKFKRIRKIWKEAEEKVAQAKNDADSEFQLIVEPHLPGPWDDYDVLMHGWKCPKSPFGMCAYSKDDDPGWRDDCIFCHEPYERK